MVVIDLNTGDFVYHLELHRRISFIRGDSGIGKTGLCAAVADNGSNVKQTLVGISEIAFITDTGARGISGYKNAVLFF